MNEEDIVRKIMEKKHGRISQPTSVVEKWSKVNAIRAVLEQDVLMFLEHPTTARFSELKMSMYWYQYWKQKEVFEEVEE